MVERTRLAALLTLLGGAADRTFDELGAAAATPPAPTAEAPLRTGNVLVALLNEDDLLETPEQRLAAVYIMFALFRGEPPTSHPFAPVLADVAGGRVPAAKRRAERHLAAQLLTSPATVGPQTPAKWLALEGTFPATSRGLPDAAHPALAGSLVLETAFPAVLPLATSATVGPVGQVRLGEPAFVAPTVRPAPPVLPIGEHEMLWTDLPPVRFSVEWDPSMGGDAANGPYMQTLMAKGFDGPLTPNQQEQLRLALVANPKLAIQLTPSKLPALVENSPVIAIDILRAMKPELRTEYFNGLVNMEMSLNSMEVVNVLTTESDLPREFIHAYIINCIKSCERTSDTSIQNRLVRLLCVFLQSLIRKKLDDVKDLFYEVQGFCIQFSRIREAAHLFRLLRTIDAPGSSAGATNGSGSSQ